MIVVFHKQFEKEFKKLSPHDKSVVTNRLELFSHNPYDRSLRNHPLKGKYAGYCSIDIRPDLRAVYYSEGKMQATFVRVGTHSQLYK